MLSKNAIHAPSPMHLAYPPQPRHSCSTLLFHAAPSILQYHLFKRDLRDSVFFLPASSQRGSSPLAVLPQCSLRCTLPSALDESPS